MDGPDLSHLLDGASSEKPSPEVLAGIVRRHRRLQARRARVAASLGLVVALAGVGVGIGVSHRGSPTRTAGATIPTTQPGYAKLVPGPVIGAPRFTAPAGGSGASIGRAPKGLDWVGARSRTGSAAFAPSVSGSNTQAPSSGSASTAGGAESGGGGGGKAVDSDVGR